MSGRSAGAADTWQAFQDFERRGWNEVAAVYAELIDAMALTTGSAGTSILDDAGVGPGQRVVDLATGPGFLARLAANRGAEVTGIDISSSMIEEARRRAPTITFEVSPAEALPLPDASVDAVVSAWGLPHFAHHRQVFQEAARVLRPGGRMALATWRPPPGNEFFAVLLGALGAHLERRPELPTGPDMFRYADPRVSAAELGDAGFVSVSSRELTFDATLANGADDLVRFLRSGSVRSQAMYLAQPEHIRRRIDDDVHAAVRRLDHGPEGRRIRLEALIISATRPT